MLELSLNQRDTGASNQSSSMMPSAMGDLLQIASTNSVQMICHLQQFAMTCDDMSLCSHRRISLSWWQNMRWEYKRVHRFLAGEMVL